jgi:predicted metal-binding transcription factor (methanogenesis marker protein 9)
MNLKEELFKFSKKEIIEALSNELYFRKDLRKDLIFDMEQKRVSLEHEKYMKESSELNKELLSIDSRKMDQLAKKFNDSEDEEERFRIASELAPMQRKLKQVLTKMAKTR